MLDRSSAPKRVPHRLPAGRVAAIKALRKLRMTAEEIAEVLGLALSTVSRWLKRIGLGKRSRLEPPEPPNRYERKRPGELVHVDIKKLGRIRGIGHRISGQRSSQNANRRERRRGEGSRGWEFVHVCVDDATRLAYAQRQGRALHRDPAEQMGLRSDLWLLGGAHRCPARLALVLQLPKETRLPRQEAARSSARRGGTRW